MSLINATLLCDGTSDFCLADLARLLIDEHFPNLTFRLNIAKEFVPARLPLNQRLEKLYQLYSPDVIICHRDAEGMPHTERHLEVTNALQVANIPAKLVIAIPVRMIESWLLCDEYAVRAAANNKNGDNAISLPVRNRIENLPDPKEKLFSVLKEASNLSHRRLQKFDTHGARSRITSHLESVTPLRELPSFKRFELEFIEKIGAIELALG